MTNKNKIKYMKFQTTSIGVLVCITRILTNESVIAMNECGHFKFLSVLLVSS